MNVTIVGGGNVGTQLAVHCAEQGHDVTVYTSKKERFSKTLQIVDEGGRVLHSGEIALATDDKVQAFSKADVVFVTLPTFCMQKIALEMYPHIQPTAKIGLVPGGGGGECAFSACVEKGCTLFALQRVPSVARLVEYGKTVRAVGYREKLHVAAIPNRETENCVALVSSLLTMPCEGLPCYLNVSLTPSNPILHTTRLRVLFSDVNEATVYASIPYFYEDWNDESSRLLLACDEEVQALCRKLSKYDLRYVKSLKEHYESPTAELLTKKIRSIKGFQGIKTPMVEKGDGYAPDFQSRYFTADFSFGLRMLIGTAKLLGLETPNMAETLAWYERVTGNTDGFRFEDYGIYTIDDFDKFYLN